MRHSDDKIFLAVTIAVKLLAEAGMSRLWISALLLAFVTPIAGAERDWVDPYDRLPRQYWDYMDGYKYEYADGCTVAWHGRTSSFLIPSNGKCPELSNEKLKSDAIKSIEYAQARSSAKNFSEYYAEIEPPAKSARRYSQADAKHHAKELWRRACLDAKELRPANPNQLIDSYPGIERMHALRLLQNARQTVTGLGGMVNCAEQGHYVVEMYASDIDIRAKDR